MKIYIAGPMTGIPEFNFPLFHAVAADLRSKGHEVFSPAEHDIKLTGGDFSKDYPTGDAKALEGNHGFSLRAALAADTAFICNEADAIFMLPGWEKSNGAKAEHALAVALGHKIFYATKETV